MDFFISPSELLGRAEELRSYQKASKVAPRYFLLCHTIELILKAYIAWRRRITADELKNLFRYDLPKLLDEAMRLGLKVGPSAENNIEKLAEAHGEYLAHPMEAANRVLVIEYLVERDIDQLFKAVRQKMAGSSGP
jgi:hypothetical protein